MTRKAETEDLNPNAAWELIENETNKRKAIRAIQYISFNFNFEEFQQGGDIVRHRKRN